MSRGNSDLANFECMNGVPCGCVSRKINHRTIVAVKGEGGEPGVCTDVECGRLTNLLIGDRLEGNDLGTPKGRLGTFIVVRGVKRSNQAPLMGKVALDLLAYPIT